MIYKVLLKCSLSPLDHTHSCLFEHFCVSLGKHFHWQLFSSRIPGCIYLLRYLLSNVFVLLYLVLLMSGILTSRHSLCYPTATFLRFLLNNQSYFVPICSDLNVTRVSSSYPHHTAHFCQPL